jgi:hypothetical protein
LEVSERVAVRLHVIVDLAEAGTRCLRLEEEARLDECVGGKGAGERVTLEVRR